MGDTKKELERINVSTGTPWEPLMGFSRLVQVGNVLYLSGTTATDSKGNVIGVGDPYLQAKRALKNVNDALSRAGASLNDVVRTRFYVTDISQWQQYARAHREVFEMIRPAHTMVEVQRLVDSRMLVSIEVEAVVGTTVTRTEMLDLD